MTVVRKILEGTLTAGSTSLSFTDTLIPNSILKVTTTNSTVFPTSQSVSGNTLQLTFTAQSSNIGVSLEIIKQGLDIVDDLISTDTDKALSAKQGKVLKDALDAIVIPEVPNVINSLDSESTTDALSAYQGKVLKDTIDDLPVPPTEITDLADVTFTSPTEGQILSIDGNGDVVNINMPASGGVSYSTTEQNTGIKWIDNKDIYQKTFDLESDLTISANAWTAVSSISISGNSIAKIIRGVAHSSTNEVEEAFDYSGNTNNMLYIYNPRTPSFPIRYITLQYTKTT